MRYLPQILVALSVISAPAYSETRLIAVDVRLQDDSDELVVSVYSDVKSEQKSRISVEEAANILKRAEGWGSVVIVGIQAHDVSLNRVMPLLTAITERGHLLAFLEAGLRPSFINNNLKKMIANGRKAQENASPKGSK